MRKRDGTSKRLGLVVEPREHQVAVVRWKMTAGGAVLYERFFLRPTAAQAWARKQQERGAVDVGVFVTSATWSEVSLG